MISIIANMAALGGTLIALFAIGTRYLIVLWPAEHVNPGQVQFRLEVIQYAGVALILVGAALVIWQAASRAKRIRVAVLALSITGLAVFSVARGNPEVQPRAEIAGSLQLSKYRFSEDWVTENTANWSRILSGFKGKTNVHALEVGSFEGRSALWFLENVLTDSTDTITCIDIWVGPYEKHFDDNVKAYGEPKKVIKIKSRSDEALRKLRVNSFDFIYIDGSHMAKDVLVDAVLSWDLLKSGGYIIFDDYNQYGPRSWLVANHTPKIAVDAFVKIFEPYLELVDKDYQLVVRKKTNDPDKINVDTYTPVRRFLIGVQQVLG